MVSIIENKDLIYDIFKYDVILVGTSTHCALGNGFQHDIAINFPIVKEINSKTPYADPKKLGTIIPVEDRGVIFILCYLNKGRYRPDLNPDFLDYNALKNILLQINKEYKNKKIASTILGNSIFEGDGNKDKILSIFNECCTDVDITLYDFEQENFQNKRYRGWQEIKNSIGKISKEEYYKLKRKFMWERSNGIWNPMPENYTWKNKTKNK